MEYLGERIYSTKEIKGMLENSMSDELLSYFEKSSDRIKRIIINWARQYNNLNDNAKILLELTGWKEDESPSTDLIDENIAVSDYTEVDEEQSVQVIVEQSDIEDSIPNEFEEQIVQVKVEQNDLVESISEESKEVNDDDFFSGDFELEEDDSSEEEISAPDIPKDPYEDYYKEYAFKDRVAPDVFVAYISSDKSCNIHNTFLKPIQVVLEYDKGRKQSFMIRSCRECKKLFVEQKDIKSLKKDLDEKGIAYKFIEKE